jgi:hypothetical protein
MTWLTSFVATEAAKSISRLLQEGELESELRGEIGKWAEEIAQLYRDTPKATLESIFAPRASSDEIETPARSALAQTIARGRVPSNDTWLQALIESWKQVRVDHGDEVQRFFRDDPQVVTPLLRDLAHRLEKVCKENPKLFQVSVFDQLANIEFLLARKSALPETSEAPWTLQKVVNQLVLDSSLPPMPISLGETLVAKFEADPDRTWHDPVATLEAAWNPRRSVMVPLEPSAAQGTQLCVPSYEVDVEWRADSHIRHGLVWRPIKARVVRRFLEACQGKSILCRVAYVRRGPRGILFHLNSPDYDNFLRHEWFYYKGLETALMVSRWVKSPRVIGMPEIQLRQHVATELLNQLPDMVPVRYKDRWLGRTIDLEDAFLVLNGLRRREGGTRRRRRSRR